MYTDVIDEPLSLPPSLARDYLVHHRMCPKALDSEGHIVVSVAPEAISEGLHDIAFAYDRPVATEIVSEAEVLRLIERLTNHTERTIELARADFGDDDTATDIRDLVNQAPVVRYVNLLVRDAYDASASDIHLESSRLGVSVRFRVDGVLMGAPEPPSPLQHAVVSRIKLLAELDIAERRRPQDGRIRVRMEARELDLRVSTVPTLHGESVVLRLLDRGGRPVALEELGMTGSILNGMLELAQRPHGLVLVTGPTGSGKTTTLYGALRTRMADVEKIITVEDPVEYHLPGITQVPVHRQAGVTFPAALRSILRQDPDVIMLGEMRDRETAEVAVQAAMTGHLVMSTLHTNDAVSAIPRMLDLGVPSYLVAATVEGILAQRLVRRVCAKCTVDYAPSSELLRQVGVSAGNVDRFSRGAGCSECRGTGYRGRVGVYELLIVTDPIKEAISSGASPGELRAIATSKGLSPLRTNALNLVLNGTTTLEEVLRVIQTQ